MRVVVIVALAIAWIVLLARSRTHVTDPVASVDQQRRALDAIATAAQTSRRSRGRAAPAAGPSAESSGARRGARRAPIVGLAVVTAASLGVGAVMLPDRLGRSRAPDRRAGSAPATTPTTTPTPTTTTGSSTTTSAPRLRSLAIGGDPASQQVTLGRNGFVLTVEADQPCWVQVRSAPDAPVTFEATLPPGGSETFPADTTLWVRLGAPGAVRLSVDGTPLEHSAAGDAPTDFAFTATAGLSG